MNIDIWHLICSNRKKLLNTVAHPNIVWDIALQPGSNGQVFVSACFDDIIRLFDTRCSVTGLNGLIPIFY